MLQFYDYGTALRPTLQSLSFYLKHLLFLWDFVVNLPAGRAGDGPPRHLLERLETARNQ